MKRILLKPTRTVARAAPAMAATLFAASVASSNTEPGSAQANVVAPQAPAVVEEDDGWDLLPEFDIVAKVPGAVSFRENSKPFSNQKFKM